MREKVVTKLLCKYHFSIFNHVSQADGNINSMIQITLRDISEKSIPCIVLQHLELNHQ